MYSITSPSLSLSLSPYTKNPQTGEHKSLKSSWAKLYPNPICLNQSHQISIYPKPTNKPTCFNKPGTQSQNKIHK